MATQTLLQGEKSARRTTVFLKILMASTGAFFVFYVLMHMFGNHKILVGTGAFDEYADHLRTMFMPVLPHSGVLWVLRTLLIVALVVHAYAAFALWSRATGARSQRYAVRNAAKGALRSQMMRWGGVALLLFLVFHLLQFTLMELNFNGAYSAAALARPDGQVSVGKLVIASFQLWWVVLIYALAMLALGMHLFHGVWSGAQTLGWANSARSRALAHTAAHLVAAVVVVGFLVPPVGILIGIVK